MRQKCILSNGKIPDRGRHVGMLTFQDFIDRTQQVLPPHLSLETPLPECSRDDSSGGSGEQAHKEKECRYKDNHRTSGQIREKSAQARPNPSAQPTE